MLLYHPFADPRHCAFRILRLLEQVGQREIEFQRIRIWDFYLLFPEALLPITLPRGNTGLKRQIDASRNRYDVLPDPKRAFARLEPMQQAAVGHLAAKGLIDPERLKHGGVRRTSRELPEQLESLIKQRNRDASALLGFLTTAFLTLDLYGARGVRSRTELFDHRYDI